MVFCTKCGSENLEDSQYCHKCGKEISLMPNHRTIYTKREIVKEKKSDDTLLNIVLIVAIVIITIVLVQMIFAYSFIAPIFHSFFG